MPLKLMEGIGLDVYLSAVVSLKHKLNMIFRAGCNSRSAVMWRRPLARERKLTRYDSGADSKVWMKEDVNCVSDCIP